MKDLLEKLHARVGDFWWYSLMIFMAARAADCLNVFVGLWLVPKYVPPSELGAVQPLANFAAFLATPIAVFASTFRQELSNLALSREFGKMKTLMKTVFIAAALFFFVAILASRLVLPRFLERIRIAEGSLGFLIIIYSFIAALAPIFQNALQSLKKFKATTVINLLGAPIRLLAMIATMPFRAISGYFVGQASTPIFSIFTSLLSLRKELSVKAEPYWTTSTLHRLSRLFVLFAVLMISGGFAALVETTILRQRIPEIESAAYYMTTRFSEIATFLCTTLSFTIFPFAAKLAAEGKTTHALVLKASSAILVFNALLALFFGLFGRPILAFLPHGDQFADYWWAIDLTILQATFWQFYVLYTTAEISANRFRFLKWLVPLQVLYPIILFTLADITTLATMLGWTIAFQAARAVGCLIDMLANRKNQGKRNKIGK